MRSLSLIALISCAGSQTTSGIPSTALTERMRELSAELAVCLNAGPADAASGLLTLSWVVEQDGRAAMVRIDNSTATDASIEGCIAGVVQRSRFPSPRDEPFADATIEIDLATLHSPQQPQASGLLGTTEVDAVLSTHQNSLASCLALAQVGGREVAGLVELQWRVGAGGRVDWARIASGTTHDVVVERCLVQTMMGLVFPAPDGGAAELSIPLKLM